MSKRFLGLIFLLLLISGFSNNRLSAQDSAYGRYLVDTLCTPYFWGRGYTNDGLDKAAHFLSTELEQHGLQARKASGFFQEFLVSVNTFPGKMDLSINGQKLRPGLDFLIAPESRGFKGKNIRLHQIDSATYKSDNGQIVMVIKEKLVWRPSQEVKDYTRIEIPAALNIESATLQIDLDIENEFIPHFKTSNICAYVPGTQYPDSFFVVTAHYDHLGGMGDQTYFPGANDNASGVALLMNLAQYYARHPLPYSIAFILFSTEELGLLGSQYFVTHPLIPLDQIKFLINTDLAGTGDDGITVVNAPAHPEVFELMQEINQQHQLLKGIYSRPNAPNSDHYFFVLSDVPAFFFYTQGGVAYYHDVLDQASTLPLNKHEDLFTLLNELFLRMSKN